MTGQDTPRCSLSRHCTVLPQCSWTNYSPPCDSRKTIHACCFQGGWDFSQVASATFLSSHPWDETKAVTNWTLRRQRAMFDVYIKSQWMRHEKLPELELRKEPSSFKFAKNDVKFSIPFATVELNRIERSETRWTRRFHVQAFSEACSAVSLIAFLNALLDMIMWHSESWSLWLA